MRLYSAPDRNINRSGAEIEPVRSGNKKDTFKKSNTQV